MKCNIGKNDKIVRITLGLIIGILGLYYQSWWGILGVILLITGLIKFCGLYILLGVNTCKLKKKKKISSKTLK